VAVSGGQENHRSIAFLLANNDELKKLETSLPNVLGVVGCSFQARGDKCRVSLSYNSEIIKGRELTHIISQVDAAYEVINDRINSFSNKGNRTEDEVNVVLTTALCLYFLIVNMILPIIPDNSWYDDYLQFPVKLGIYSLSLIFNFLVTMFVMVRYARGFIVRAFRNYIHYRVTNMETLIALGSISAFSLFLFFLGRYTIEYVNGQIEMPSMAIMDINDALTSASIIVLVVTIGKYFEGKVKQKIEKMTEEIFPESSLFSNMQVQYVEIKNRQLTILEEKQLDASLVEKNDIIKVVPGRLLLDVIIISGSVKAVQSARTGCED